MLTEALGDLAGDVDFQLGHGRSGHVLAGRLAPVDSMARRRGAFYDGAPLLPMRMVGTTDARHFRRALGTTAYGFGMFSQRMDLEDLAAMGHGDDERIDVESLEMVTELWDVLVRDFLG